MGKNIQNNMWKSGERNLSKWHLQYKGQYIEWDPFGKPIYGAFQTIPSQ